jgi:hypothetical protein
VNTGKKRVWRWTRYIGRVRRCREGGSVPVEVSWGLKSVGLGGGGGEFLEESWEETILHLCWLMKSREIVSGEEVAREIGVKIRECLYAECSSIFGSMVRLSEAKSLCYRDQRGA